MPVLKRSFLIFPIVLFVFLLVPLFVLPVKAKASLSYPEYKVDMIVNEDSTVDITESLTYKFVGEYHGVIRQITLDDRERASVCSQEGYTCGGFDNLTITGVFDQNGKDVTDQVEIYEEEVEDSSTRYLTLKWVVWPDGYVFNNQEFTWVIKYRVYGSIGWIGTKYATAEPYLYWNALPEDRGGLVQTAKVNITLPTGVNAEEERFTLYTDDVPTYDYEDFGNKISISADNLSSYGNFTVAYRLNRGSIIQPARLSYTNVLPMTGLNIALDGTAIETGKYRLNNFPVGDHTLVFSYPGYEDKTFNLEVESGAEITLDATLTPTPFMWLLIFIDIALFIVGIVLIPLSVIYVYKKWQSKGKDVDMPKTIIPEFVPPKDVPPYTAGSLIDETVDMRDVTATIIDLAYRGHLTIVEKKKGKNYELIKKETTDTRNAFEEELFSALFGGKESVETEDLGPTFASKYPKLVKTIYDELVEKGYYTDSPDKVRQKYAGMGIGLVVLSFALGIGLLMFGLMFLGVPGPLTLAVALFTLGVAYTVASKHMPAKTSSGSKVLAHLLGFKMFMYTAERFRLKDLKPEDFEKYLSYAVAFKVEESWAEKFKDIYKGNPEWYQGSSTMYDTFLITSLTNSFSTAMTTKVYSYVASGGSSGGGWSGGGGSFGGFSGGGGGGGSSGAF